ncbi:MAG: hypothetical protein LBP24_03500 [Coriobacteriales bacterium]|jgi:hypothetical protein|nr:hypothetical protein [Coriobacteriales bacterium]
MAVNINPRPDPRENINVPDVPSIPDAAAQESIENAPRPAAQRPADIAPPQGQTVPRILDVSTRELRRLQRERDRAAKAEVSKPRLITRTSPHRRQELLAKPLKKSASPSKDPCRNLYMLLWLAATRVCAGVRAPPPSPSQGVAEAASLRRFFSFAMVVLVGREGGGIKDYRIARAPPSTRQFLRMANIAR